MSANRKEVTQLYSKIVKKLHTFSAPENIAITAAIQHIEEHHPLCDQTIMSILVGEDPVVGLTLNKLRTLDTILENKTAVNPQVFSWIQSFADLIPSKKVA
jgi:hypothetical protein